MVGAEEQPHFARLHVNYPEDQEGRGKPRLVRCNFVVAMLGVQVSNVSPHPPLVEETHSFLGQCVSFSLIDVGSGFTANIVFFFFSLHPVRQKIWTLILDVTAYVNFLFWTTRFPALQVVVWKLGVGLVGVGT